ncbi:proline-rich protein 19 isoform X2 [Engystomops pustulosus]|uniref:proline-rich protein 19 isoform X2 n=1 Tax=Engystomops pustulosus TaxID=76066 RepID=UPI003AFAAF57
MRPGSPTPPGPQIRVMSEDPPCPNDPIASPRQDLIPGPARSLSRLLLSKDDLTSIHDPNKTLRIQRRRTKKERNNATSMSHTEVFKKKPLPRGVHPRSSLASKMAAQSVTKGAFNPLRVFITEKRLTSHQGIFNREIKSIEIGRLLEPSAEAGPSPAGTAQCRKTPQDHRDLHLHPRPGSKNQDVPSPPEDSPGLLPNVSEPAECSRQEPPEEEKSPDRAEPGGEATTSPQQLAPILETAESVINLLSAHSLFPDRDLVKETRRDLLDKARNIWDIIPEEPARGEHLQIGDDPMCNDQCVGTDTERSAPDTQNAAQPIPVSPQRFRPFPRDSPAHTIIKMMNPDHLRHMEIGQQPLHYGPGAVPSSLSPRSVVSVHSSGHRPSLRQGRRISGSCRVRRTGRMSSIPMDDSSPEVRWRLPNDLPADSSYNVPSRYIRHIRSSRVTKPDCGLRTPMGDLSEEPYLSGIRMEQSSSDNSRTSDVFWSTRGQRSSPAKTLEIYPKAARLPHRTQGPHRTYSESNLGGQHRYSLQTPVTGARGPSGLYSLDVFGEQGRETERFVSSWQGAGLGQHDGAAPKRRCLHESGRHYLCNSPSREDPCPRGHSGNSPRGHLWNMPSTRGHPENNPSRHPGNNPSHRGHPGSNVASEWLHSEDWPHRRSHGDPRISPQFTRKGFTFIPFPRGNSTKKEVRSNRSPGTWVYPRMKLYL